jgi:membrane fusion protein, heavy metal efflux system
VKLIVIIPLVLIFSGCSREPEQKAPAAGAPAPAANASADPQTVKLDASAQKEAGLQIVEAVLRPVAQTVRATGRLVNNENTTWRVGAVTDGRIVHVFSKVGDMVKEGQVLADMHSHDIHEARASYQKAVADLGRMQSNDVFAGKNRDRMRRLFEMKAASQEQAEAAENELKNAATAVKNAEVEVERTRKHLTDFLDIPAVARSDDDDHVPIKAPAAGVVLSRSITPGSVVTASADLFVICDLSTIWALASVQEEYLTRIRVGMPARVFVQAYEAKPFLGQVGKIGVSLDASTRTVSVRVDLNNAGGLLKPEMYAAVEFDVGGTEEAILIPEAAPQDLNGQAVVFLARGGDRFEARPVELGRAVEGQVQVLRGVKPGERVAGRGSFILKSQLLKSTLGEE